VASGLAVDVGAFDLTDLEVDSTKRNRLQTTMERPTAATRVQRILNDNVWMKKAAWQTQVAWHQQNSKNLERAEEQAKATTFLSRCQANQQNLQLELSVYRRPPKAPNPRGLSKKAGGSASPTPNQC